VAGIISDEARARRLAVAIAEDLRLYNKTKIDTGADLSAEIAEGRALFHGRVASELHHLFEEEAAKLAGRAAPKTPPVAPRPPPPVTAPAPAPAQPFASFYETPAPTSQPSGTRAPLILVALLVVAVMAWALLLRR
jgi:hypothetical protein